MTLFHEDIAGEEAPYGTVSVRKGEHARLPKRGSTIVQAQVRLHLYIRLR